MKRGRTSLIGIYTVAISVLFMAGFLMLVVFGAHIYRNTVENQNDNNNTRALLSYISSCVKANESAEVHVKNTDRNGPVLIIYDGNSGYAQRIYKYKDTLLEDYDRVGASLNPKDAEVIGNTKEFRIKRKTDRLLEVRTDGGRVLLHLQRKIGS